MNTETLQDGVPKLANSDHLDGLLDNQEREQQKAEKKAGRAIRLEQDRPARTEGHAAIVHRRAPVTPDTVNIWDRWLQDVRDDRFRAATTYGRKTVEEVGGRYLGGQQFRVRLPW
jgi:hypothetical protein